MINDPELNGSNRRNPKLAKERKQREENRRINAKENCVRPEPTKLIEACEETLALWHKVLDLLEAQQTLHKCDVMMLELFVFNAVQLEHVSLALLKHGHYDIAASNGVSRRNALSVTFEKLTAAHHKYLRELELTPATRPEVIGGTGHTSLQDELESIFGRD